jgi:hypothetical protein
LEKVDDKGNTCSTLPFNEKFTIVFMTKVQTEEEFKAVCENIPSDTLDKIIVN